MSLFARHKPNQDGACFSSLYAEIAAVPADAHQGGAKAVWTPYDRRKTSTIAVSQDAATLTRNFNFLAAGQIEDLDWADDLRDTIENGWIDRGGLLYGCGFGAHEHVMMILGRNVRDVELEGWIKIDQNRWYMAPAHEMIRPTPAQRQTLNRIGRFADDPHYRQHGLDFNAAYPHGNHAPLRRARAAKKGLFEALDDARALKTLQQRFGL